MTLKNIPNIEVPLRNSVLVGHTWPQNSTTPSLVEPLEGHIAIYMQHCVRCSQVELWIEKRQMSNATKNVSKDLVSTS
jgi:hypothetical protein